MKKGTGFPTAEAVGYGSQPLRGSPLVVQFISHFIDASAVCPLRVNWDPERGRWAVGAKDQIVATTRRARTRPRSRMRRQSVVREMPKASAASSRRQLHDSSA